MTENIIKSLRALCPFCKVELECFAGASLHFTCANKYIFLLDRDGDEYIFFYLNSKTYQFDLGKIYGYYKKSEGAQLNEYDLELSSLNQRPYSFTGIYIKDIYLENFAENIKMLLTFS